MDKMLRNKKIIALFILPALILYAVLVLIPALCSVFYSFFNWNLIDKMKFVGLDNYKFLFFDDDVFRIALKNTCIVLVLSIIFQLPMSFLLANTLSKRIRGRNFFRNVIFLPVTFSGVAVSLMWYFIYHPEVGLVNQFLRAMGLENFSFAWLGESSTALNAVIISVAWQWIGYHMVIYITGITNISSEMIESAKIDGANEWQIVKNITIPLILPMAKVSAVLMTTGSLKYFDNIFIMTLGGPNHASEVLASHMYTKAFSQMKYGYGSTISTLLLILCIIATVLINKLFNSRIEKL